MAKRHACLPARVRLAFTWWNRSRTECGVDCCVREASLTRRALLCLSRRGSARGENRASFAISTEHFDLVTFPRKHDFLGSSFGFFFRIEFLPIQGAAGQPADVEVRWVHLRSRFPALVGNGNLLRTSGDVKDANSCNEKLMR